MAAKKKATKKKTAKKATKRAPKKTAKKTVKKVVKKAVKSKGKCFIVKKGASWQAFELQGKHKKLMGSTKSRDYLIRKVTAEGWKCIPAKNNPKDI